MPAKRQGVLRRMICLQPRFLLIGSKLLPQMHRVQLLGAACLWLLSNRRRRAGQRAVAPSQGMYMPNIGLQSPGAPDSLSQNQRRNYRLILGDLCPATRDQVVSVEVLRRDQPPAQIVGMPACVAVEAIFTGLPVRLRLSIVTLLLVNICQ